MTGLADSNPSKRLEGGDAQCITSPTLLGDQAPVNSRGQADSNPSSMRQTLARERETLRRLERIRRCAWEEGAWGTPGLDKDITETREVIARLSCRHGVPFDVHCKRCALAGFCGCPECAEDAEDA